MDLNQQRIIKQMRIQGIGYKKIAKTMKLPESTVSAFCRRNGLSSKEVSCGSQSRNISVCNNCGEILKHSETGRERKFCSDTCRMQWWNDHLDLVNRKAYYSIVCQNCGRIFQSYGNRDRKYCCKKCYISKRFEK